MRPCRRLLLLAALSTCAGVPKGPPETCSPGWSILHERAQCEDIRGEISGFIVYDVIAGAHRGRRVVAAYGEGARRPPGAWSIARLRMEPTTIERSWDNLCSRGPYAGSIATFQTYASEAEARDAFRLYCE
jgi:hypothetical protein